MICEILFKQLIITSDLIHFNTYFGEVKMRKAELNSSFYDQSSSIKKLLLGFYHSR